MLSTAIALLALAGCSGGSGESNPIVVPPPGPTRPFLMGFTDWPYDSTLEAVDWVRSQINLHGDVVSQHLEEGVPWAEAYAGTAWPRNFLDEIEFRVNHLVKGKKVELEIGPLNILRNAIAENRGAGTNEPTPAPWNGYALDSPQVKQAYLAYARKMVASFKPDYLLIGVEVNVLVRNSPALWPAYVNLHRYVYQTLKAENPDLMIGVSVFCVPFFPQWSSQDNKPAQLAALADLLPYVDYLGFSLHPFMSSLLAESFPDDYLDQLFLLAGDKPIAVTESSYPAQVWSADVSGVTLTWNGTEAKQLDFATKLLTAARKYSARYVIWFEIRDYDALWNGVLHQDPGALTWRDTGLYDENGVVRSALVFWDQILSQTKN
jgi:hypothetical protein